MRCVLPLILAVLPAPSAACERVICSTDQPLPFTQRATFEAQPSGFGPGRQIVGVLVMQHIRFGQHFAGQTLGQLGDYDDVDGRAVAPLALLPGDVGKNLSVLRLTDANILSGDGPAGVPRTEATGEGAIAIAFELPQRALRLTLRGGEGGTAQVQFLTIDGAVLDSHTLGPLGEDRVTFIQTRGADISGVVITNQDPQGLGLQIVEFQLAAPIG